MSDVYLKVIEYLKIMNSKYECIPEENIIRAIIKLDIVNCPCEFYFPKDSQRFYSYVNMLVQVPPEKYPEITELVTRSNYGDLCGTFEFDYDRGRLRYRVISSVPGGVATEEMIHEAMFGCVMVSNRLVDPV